MISILLPTRNRPDNVRRLYQSIVNTADDIKDIELCFYVDEDDVISLPVIEELANEINAQCIQGEPAPNVRVPVWFLQNELQKIATGPIYMFSADDIVFRTTNWDKIVKDKFNEFEDKIALVYGPDGFQKGPVPVCTHGFLHKNWIDTVGYLFPSQFNVAFVDQWVTEIAEKLRRRFYINEMYIEHVHPAAGKAAWDSTYTTKQESPGGEANIYLQLNPVRQDIVDKLKKYIESFK